MKLDVENFLHAMSCAASQVTVVTTQGAAGKFGVTVSAFASLSAEPPLILACINKNSPAVQAIEENKCFGVNLLASQQQAVANCFAGKSHDHPAYEFECAEWQMMQTGAPLLTHAMASFDCMLHDFHDHGTHRIHIGSVQHVICTPQSPLAFSQRKYQEIHPKDRNPQ